MKIGVEAARKYWSHPTQHSFGHTGDDLPDWAEYWADGDVCLMTHPWLWPGVLGVHLGVLPSAWGGTVEPVRRLLNEVWQAKQPERLVAHVDEKNRLTVALARKVGMEIDGITPLRSGAVLLFGWGK